MKTYNDLAAKWDLKPYCPSGVQNGWVPMLDKLCQDLTNTSYDLKKVAQIKEKFGGLRFYADDVTDEQQALIRDAEGCSYKTCETCGEPGKCQNIGNWMVTCCEECAEKMKAKRNQR